MCRAAARYFTERGISAYHKSGLNKRINERIYKPSL